MKTVTKIHLLITFVYVLSIPNSFGQSNGQDQRQDPFQVKIDALLQKAFENSDSLIIYAEEAYVMAQNVDSIHTQIEILNFIDDYHYENLNNQDMVDNLKKLLPLYTKLEDYKNVLRVYNYMCKPYRNLLKFDSLFVVFEKGMEIAERTNNEKAKANFYLEMGDYYNIGLKDFEKAVGFLKKALPYHLSDTAAVIGLSRVYHDLGKNYIHLGELDSVEKYSNLGIIAANKSGKESVIEILYSLRGDALSSQDRFEESIPFTKKALELSRKVDRDLAILFNLNVMVSSYLGLDRNLSDIPKMLDESEALAIKTEDRNQHVLIQELRSEYYSKVGDHKNALLLYEKMVNMRDELNKELQLQDLESLSQKHEIKEKERDLVFLKSKNESQKTISKLMFSLLGLTLLIGAFIWRSFRLKSALNRKELAVLKAEKLKEESEIERIKALQRIEEEKNEVLKKQLEHNERELVSTTLFITKKNEILTSIKESIKNAATKPTIDKNELTIISNLIDKNLDVEDDWEAFKMRFEQVHPTFFTTLKSQFPKVNSNDSRLLGFIKMGMDNNEIARISGVNTTSIYKARYRLRKKLELDESIDLDKFALEMI